MTGGPWALTITEFILKFKKVTNGGEIKLYSGSMKNADKVHCYNTTMHCTQCMYNNNNGFLEGNAQQQT